MRIVDLNLRKRSRGHNENSPKDWLTLQNSACGWIPVLSTLVSSTLSQLLTVLALLSILVCIVASQRHVSCVPADPTDKKAKERCQTFTRCLKCYSEMECPIVWETCIQSSLKVIWVVFWKERRGTPSLIPPIHTCACTQINPGLFFRTLGHMLCIHCIGHNNS